MKINSNKQIFDKELGFDMSPKTFSECFKYYLIENEKKYEIYKETENEYKGHKIKAYFLTNDVLITAELNSSGNIACLLTGAEKNISEIYSLDVMMDIFKAIVYPYPDNWREVFRRVYDLRSVEETTLYGVLAFYKLIDDEGLIIYVLAPENYVFKQQYKNSINIRDEYLQLTNMAMKTRVFSKIRGLVIKNDKYSENEFTTEYKNGTKTIFRLNANNSSYYVELSNNPNKVFFGFSQSKHDELLILFECALNSIIALSKYEVLSIIEELNKNGIAYGRSVICKLINKKGELQIIITENTKPYIPFPNNNKSYATFYYRFIDILTANGKKISSQIPIETTSNQYGVNIHISEYGGFSVLLTKENEIFSIVIPSEGPPIDFENAYALYSLIQQTIDPKYVLSKQDVINLTNNENGYKTEFYNFFNLNDKGQTMIILLDSAVDICSLH